MREGFRSFVTYYREFSRELCKQVWAQWRSEVWPGLAIAAIVFLLSKRGDTSATIALVMTLEASAIYVIGWAMYHMVRTPWMLSLRRFFPEVATPKSGVDLCGDILEVYIRYPDDKFFPMTQAFVFMNARIVNHGVDETAVTSFGLWVELGDYRKAGSEIPVPDTLRIRKPMEGVFLSTSFVETPLSPSLGVLPHEKVYVKGKPREGWLAFQVFVHGSEEIPNVKFDLLLMDSFGQIHHIIRNPGVYRNTGQLVLASN